MTPRPVPCPDREKRQRAKGRRGMHPLTALFGALTTGTPQGMYWLVNRSGYYPKGVWARVPDPYDVPWPEVVMIFEKAKGIAPRLNPLWLDAWITSIKSKFPEDFA